MFGLLLRSSMTFVSLAGLLYVTFLVRVGSYTPYEHLQRIAGTAEAAELQSEVVRLMDDLTNSVAGVIGSVAAVGSKDESAP